jgi:hypothetical protein
VREPRLALPAYGHQREPLAREGPLEELPDALPLFLELQIPPEGDHRPLPGVTLAVHRVPDRFGILKGHARLLGGSHHVFVTEQIAAHAASCPGTPGSAKGPSGLADLRP